ncbi:MAG: ferritin-like domain-containing protein [Chitinophagaceae bacterium]
MLENLLKDEEKYIVSLIKGIKQEEIANEPSVADLLTGILNGHEKKAWIIRAHLQ